MSMGKALKSSFEKYCKELRSWRLFVTDSDPAKSEGERKKIIILNGITSSLWGVWRNGIHADGFTEMTAKVMCNCT